jgi:hypothetical protein
LRHRVVEAALLGARLAEIDIGFDEVRIERERALILADRLLGPSCRDCWPPRRNPA